MATGDATGWGKKKTIGTADFVCPDPRRRQQNQGVYGYYFGFKIV
ncbi:MAG TPA: hypothetical protein PLC36_09745 [Flavobacterium sp.]|jgi:hypothetical protein|nr:hypothetical protein [Flavobacterium sp.]